MGWATAPRVGDMRDVFHEQLDAIFSDLASICRNVEAAVGLGANLLVVHHRHAA